jgi:hypothetical protein
MNGTADRGSQGSRRDIEENRPSSGSVKIPLLQKESSTRGLLGGMGFADEFVEDVVEEDEFDGDDCKVPAERLVAILNVSHKSKIISTVQRLQRWTFCASSMSNLSPISSLIIWTVAYFVTLIPVICYKIHHRFVGATAWCLFLALLILQVISALLCLFYLKYVTRNDVSRVIFKLPAAAAAREPGFWSCMNRTDANLLWWLAINVILAFVDLFDTKDPEETLCYLVWNFASTLPVSISVSMIAGMLTSYKLQIEKFYDDRVRVPFAVSDMKIVGHEYTRMHKHLFVQSNVNSLYLCMIMIIASIITFVEVVRIYMKQTVLASVLCKGLFYWVALFEVFTYIARLNHYGKFVSHQFLIQVLQVRGFLAVSLTVTCSFVVVFWQVYTATQFDSTNTLSTAAIALHRTIEGQIDDDEEVLPSPPMVKLASSASKSRPIMSRQGSQNMSYNNASSEVVTQNLMVAAMLISSLPHLKLEFTIFGRFALSFESTLALLISGLAVVAPKFIVPLIAPGYDV